MRLGKENGVRTEKISVYGTAANLHELPAWQVLTPTGTYTFEGFSMDAYLDSTVEVWVRDTEIIRVTGVAEWEVTYENLLVDETEGKKSSHKLSSRNKQLMETIAVGV